MALLATQGPIQPRPGCPGQTGWALQQPHPPRAWEPLPLAWEGWTAELAAASGAQNGGPRAPVSTWHAVSPATAHRASAPVPCEASRAVSWETWCPSCGSAQVPCQAPGSPEDTLPLREDVSRSSPHCGLPDREEGGAKAPVPGTRRSSCPVALSLVLGPPRGPRSLPLRKGRLAVSATAPRRDGGLRAARPSGTPQPPGVSLPLPSPWQSSYPIWEDFNSKATKLHSQLR